LNDNVVLELKNVSKRFPGVQALKGVDFRIRKGKVVSLVGTNGAGKSTLFNIIAGTYMPTEGEIFLDDRRVKISNAGIAEKLGIGMVHQEPTFISNMTVTANIFLNREILKKGLFLDFKAMNKKSAEVIRTLGFEINPQQLLSKLDLVEREAVEIAKAMLVNPRILLLDEPTAPLNKKEVGRLFEIINELKDKGVAIVFIGHNIKEIIEISDIVVVLRDGEKVAELVKNETLEERKIINLMLGESEGSISGEEDLRGIEVDEERNKSLLEIKDFSIKGCCKDINIHLGRGEILGLAGLKDAGITELFQAIYGLKNRGRDSGEILFKGKKINIQYPSQAIAKGIGLITNDRQQDGLALIRDVKENLTISSLDFLKNRFGFLKTKMLREKTKNYINKLNIKVSGMQQEVQFVSGGNQQKIVMAKLLLRNLDLLLVNEPTRGIDVKAKNEIYKLLLREKQNGRGIIVTSPEVHELLKICDRILVLVEGNIVREFKRGQKNFNEGSILELMHSTLSKDQI